MAAIDTHVHLASPDGDRYPRQPMDVGSPWWHRDGYSADEVLATVTGAGVAGLLAVQAVGVYGYDNAYVVDAAARHPDRVRAVVAVDMDRPDPAADVRREGGRPGVVGVRLFAVAPGSSWVGTHRGRAAVEAVADLGLTLVLTVFQAQLAVLRPLLEARPSLGVAIDHCAFPDLADGVIAADQPVLTLADLPQVALKVSSHLFGSLGGDGDPAPLIDQLVRRFGPDRLLWGSDFPQTAHSSYAELVAQGRRAVRHLDPADQAAVLGDNAASRFDLHPPE